jgi:hypothetical protein
VVVDPTIDLFDAQVLEMMALLVSIEELVRGPFQGLTHRRHERLKRSIGRLVERHRDDAADPLSILREGQVAWPEFETVDHRLEERGRDLVVRIRAGHAAGDPLASNLVWYSDNGGLLACGGDRSTL